MREVAGAQGERTELRLGLLDRVAVALSPAWALRRARARVGLEMLRTGYAGAKRGRRTAGWFTPTTDGGTEAGAAGPLLRDRARDLVRNDPLAAQGVAVWATALVGNGIRPRIPGTGLVVDREWERFSQGCSECGGFGETLRVAVEALVVSGEVLVRLVLSEEPEEENPSGVHLQVLEPDHLDRSLDKALDGGGKILRGIEYGPGGERVAYHLLREHPGAGSFALRSPLRETQRVPAAQVAHLYLPGRPGQDRGVSWFAPVMLKMMDLADYDEAELIRNKVAACFGLFVSNDGELVAEQGDSGGSGPIVEKLSPGMIKYLRPGESVQFSNPPGPTNAYSPYTVAHQRAISSGLGVPYELLTNDLSQVNYSSFRAGMNHFIMRVRQVQQLALVPKLCVPVWRWFVMGLVFHGKLGSRQAARALREVRWGLPKFESIEPLKDAQAALLKIRMGELSYQEHVASTGGDWEERLEEIREANRKMDQLEVVLDSDPRRMTRAGGPVGVGEPGGEEEGEDQEEEEGEEEEAEAPAPARPNGSGRPPPRPPA